jgi:hypothetical protein
MPQVNVTDPMTGHFQGPVTSDSVSTRTNLGSDLG